MSEEREGGRCCRPCRRHLLLLPMVVATVLCYVTREFYPLSAFPMYSKFDPRDYYVYFRAADGSPLATVPTFNAFTTVLKKDYSDELRGLKEKFKGSHHGWSQGQRAEAGAAAIAYWRGQRFPEAFAGGKLDGAELVDVRITRGEGGRILRDEVVVGKVEPAP